jgi:hypothetical protein
MPRIICCEIAMRPMRSPRIAAIASTGGRSTARPGREAEPVDPIDLGEQPDHLPEGERDADPQHPDDER